MAMFVGGAEIQPITSFSLSVPEEKEPKKHEMKVTEKEYMGENTRVYFVGQSRLIEAVVPRKDAFKMRRGQDVTFEFYS